MKLWTLFLSLSLFFCRLLLSFLDSQFVSWSVACLYLADDDDTEAGLVCWSKNLTMYLVAYRVDRNAAVYLKEREGMD